MLEARSSIGSCQTGQDELDEFDGMHDGDVLSGEREEGEVGCGIQMFFQTGQTDRGTTDVFITSSDLRDFKELLDEKVSEWERERSTTMMG